MEDLDTTMPLHLGCDYVSEYCNEHCLTSFILYTCSNITFLNCYILLNIFPFLKFLQHLHRACVILNNARRKGEYTLYDNKTVRFIVNYAQQRMFMFPYLQPVLLMSGFFHFKNVWNLLFLPVVLLHLIFLQVFKLVGIHLACRIEEIRRWGVVCVEKIAMRLVQNFIYPNILDDPNRKPSQRSCAP